ncbi:MULTISPECIES: hypothetical protein [unclassified Streptomyces]|uniref:hypothetical protein n=1 Tax=unclassified Streptomyces TaxID=2593676 RepID=UPI002E376F4D|nr:hypothetical protein [Streptomyces sp. NBC_01477]
MRVVGKYVQTFDASSRSPFQRYIPPMRSAQDASGSGGSATPIYDALYSEYRRLFRTLPGDRTGEESLQFNSFSSWQPDFPPTSAGRHRGNGPAALPPGRPDNRMHER